MTQLNFDWHYLHSDPAVRCLLIVLAQAELEAARRMRLCRVVHLLRCLKRPETVAQGSSILFATGPLALECSSRLYRRLERRPSWPAAVLGPASEESRVRPEV